MDDDLLVGRYRRVRALGSGGMGDVWLADDLDLGRPVAVKRLRFGGPEGLEAELVERMLREARVVARLTHPAIVTLHDLVRVEGRPHLIMEYVDGESLADRIEREGRLDWAQVAPVIADVAGALAVAHRAGVLHRDVKPANVLIGSDGRGHLADFGIARGVGDAVITQPGDLVGTVAYLPPEVARSQEATTASDVWSLGATFFAAIEGAAPFADSVSSAPAIIARLISDDAPPPRRAGVCNDLLGRMLATDPADRPYAVAVATEIGELLAVPASPPAPETRESSLPRIPAGWLPAAAEPPQRPRRRGRPVAAVALLVAAVVAVVAFLVWPDDGDDDDAPASSSADAPAATPSGFAPVAVGASPTRAELAPDGTAYVAATGSDVVLQVRPTGEARAFDVGEEPGIVTVSSDGAFVYVPCADGTVSVIDTEAGSVDSVAVGGPAGSLRLSDDDATLYVPVDDGTIRVVDTATLDVTTTLDVGPAPGLVHLTADGRTALSPDSEEGTVTVFDTATSTVRRTLDVPGANGIQITSDGERAYVTASEGQVHVIDPAAARVVDVVDLGTPTRGRIRIAPADDFAWVPDTEGTTVAVVDLETGEVARTVEVGRTPGGTVVFDATGDTAFVSVYGRDDLVAIDTATYAVTRISTRDAPLQLTAAPDDSLLYVVGLRADDPERGTVAGVPMPR